MSAAATLQAKSQRLVPSENVYRQIFDAEVQLVQTLEKSKAKSKSGMQLNKKWPGRPVIQTEPPAAGMLTNRQLAWLKELPNEPYTENPVVEKFYADQKHAERAAAESLDAASDEVRGLPDTVEPAAHTSGIIEKIDSRRQQRHDATLEDMQHDLSRIGSDLECLIEATGKKLLEQLDENDLVLRDISASIADDKLHDIWQSITLQTAVRKNFVRAFNEEMSSLETMRMNKIRSVFETVACELEKIGYMVLPSIHQLLDKKCQVINQTVLANQRSYADLVANLLMADVEHEHGLYMEWTERMRIWKQNNCDHAVQRFTEFMSSDEVTNPAGVQRVLDEFVNRQTELNTKRVELLMSLQNLKPPECRIEQVTERFKEIHDLSQQIDAVNQEYFNCLCLENEQLCQRCLEEMDKMKHDLIDKRVCTVEKADELAMKQCVPLVGELQTKCEKSLEIMDSRLQSQNAAVLARLKTFYNHCNEVANVWGSHEIGFAQCQTKLNDALDEARAKHDTTSQELEATLEVIMDRMRQEATEAALSESLKKALVALNNIKASYDEFHDRQSEIALTYPGLIANELTAYDRAICSFYHIRRASSASGASGISSEKSKGVGKLERHRGKSKEARLATENEGEIISTDNGTMYIGDVDKAQKILLKVEVVNELDADLPPYVTSIDVSDSVLATITKSIKMNMLNHLEDWREEAGRRAESILSTKLQKLDSELSLCNRLHEPRAKRIEVDVHNVRAAELLMHAERVERHQRGTEQTIVDLRLGFTRMVDEQEKMFEEFRAHMQQFETIFVNATKSSKLATLSARLQTEKKKLMDKIRPLISQYGYQVTTTIQKLHESNARFLKSFKLFSEGGNFCPAEVETFSKQLQALTATIDRCEGSLMGQAEGIEAKRLEQVTKTITRVRRQDRLLEQVTKSITQFEYRFKTHTADLQFMEAISRWLTSTQVKIKTEVADSNAQSQTISRLIAALSRDIDSCENPHPDKPHVAPRQLSDSLPNLFELLTSRSVYLKCLRDPVLSSSMATVRALPTTTGSTVLRSANGSIQQGAVKPVLVDGLTPISVAGKLVDDQSVVVIKDILKTQKCRADGILEIVPSVESIPLADDSKKGQKKAPLPKSDSKNDKKKVGLPKNVFEVDPSQSQDDQDESTHFLGRIRRILREAMDGLLATSELYYKQKGVRPVTRPQVIQETFEKCAEVLTEKCLSYNKQATDYHNQCLLEFRRQLADLMPLIGLIPSRVINELLDNTRLLLDKSISSLNAEFETVENSFLALKELHSAELRPSLGHPQQRACLDDLCERESKRNCEMLTAITEHERHVQDVMLQLGRTFLESLARTSEALLLQSDNLLLVEEILPAEHVPSRLPPSELLRRQKCNLPLESDPAPIQPLRGQTTWPGIPMTELEDLHKTNQENKSVDSGLTTAVTPTTRIPVDIKPAQSDGKGNARKLKFKTPSYSKAASVSNTSVSVTTAKTSDGHRGAVIARDLAYQTYKANYEAKLQELQVQTASRLTAERRWKQNWLTSVETVKQLY